LLAYIQQNAWERKTYRKASAIITHSQWSADILVREYHQPARKVSFFPVPASIPASAVPERITEKELSPLKLLLVGREYERKGIDIAIDVANQLNREGIETQLRIVGLDGQEGEHVRFMGLYNKTIPEQLKDYVANYRWANFLIHPARFEAAGIVPSEAAAFGTPTITDDVGGLGTTVADGVSGIVLPKNSPAEAYVAALKSAIENRAAYNRLCEKTRERYERELNWEAAGRVFYETIEKAIA
jgi:glycosyltransferase involved in cell wall biosynthesis